MRESPKRGRGRDPVGGSIGAVGEGPGADRGDATARAGENVSARVLE